MGLSHTIARERLFEPLRRRLGGRSTWVGYLVSCPYCVSHWIAFVLVPLTGAYSIDVVVGWRPAALALRWFLSSVLVAILAAFFRVLFYFVDETQGLVRRQQRTAEEEASTRRALRERLEAAPVSTPLSSSLPPSLPSPSPSQSSPLPSEDGGVGH